MRLAWITVVALLVAACNHAESRPVMAPSGGRGWFISCRHDQGACLDEAATLCPHGYAIVDEEQHAGPTTVHRIGSTFAAAHHFRGSMTVECRHSSAAVPTSSD